VAYTDEILLEAERIIRVSQISDREPRFDFIVEGEGQCKLYQGHFMIVLRVWIKDTWILTYQASERLFRTPDEQCKFLVFSREVAGVQRSIERCLNRADYLCPA
jgi:hypothetical protein